MTIQDQGSFAVAGTVITIPGTFDPYKGSTPEGETLAAITHMCFIRFR